MIPNSELYSGQESSLRGHPQMRLILLRLFEKPLSFAADYIARDVLILALPKEKSRAESAFGILKLGVW